MVEAEWWALASVLHRLCGERLIMAVEETESEPSTRYANKRRLVTFHSHSTQTEHHLISAHN